jgi:hypothetical protein|tara:strand:+ start:59 stop:1162 length:1104 start_codon:yes stop_codon:yes gene_type:complete
MGFNLMSFLGGAALGGEEILDENRAYAKQKELTAEERKWQIATEDRADARTRRAKRDARIKDDDTLLEQLTFHYGAEKAPAMAKQGRGYVTEALKRASLYSEAGYDPGTMVEIGSLTGEDLPSNPPLTGPNAPAALSKGALTFKPVPKKVTAVKNTWEAKLVEHTDARLSISADDADAIANWEKRNDALVDGHASWKAATSKKLGDTEGQLDFSKRSRDAILQDPINNILKTNNVVEVGVDGKILKAIAGEEAKVLGLRARVIAANSVAYKDVTDEPFQVKLKAQQNGLVADTIAYANSIRFNTNNPTIGITDKKAFVPLIEGEPRTRGDITSGLASGEYIPNQVVEYIDDNNNIRFGVVSAYGVLN